MLWYDDNNILWYDNDMLHHDDNDNICMYDVWWR